MPMPEKVKEMPVTQAQDISPAEARAIAKEAYIYGFPFVEGYKTLYKQSVNKSSPEFKAPFTQIAHARGPATPETTWVVTPNSDTPYSFAWLDLRAVFFFITTPTPENSPFSTPQLIPL